MDAVPLHAGQRAWRIHEWTGLDGFPRFIVFRCVVMRILAAHRVEVASSTLTTNRMDLPEADVFADELAARAERSRRAEAAMVRR